MPTTFTPTFAHPPLPTALRRSWRALGMALLASLAACGDDGGSSSTSAATATTDGASSGSTSVPGSSSAGAGSGSATGGGSATASTAGATSADATGTSGEPGTEVFSDVVDSRGRVPAVATVEIEIGGLLRIESCGFVSQGAPGPCERSYARGTVEDRVRFRVDALGYLPFDAEVGVDAMGRGLPVVLQDNPDVSSVCAASCANEVLCLGGDAQTIAECEMFCPEWFALSGDIDDSCRAYYLAFEVCLSTLACPEYVAFADGVADACLEEAAAIDACEEDVFGPGGDVPGSTDGGG